MRTFLIISWIGWIATWLVGNLLINHESARADAAEAEVKRLQAELCKQPPKAVHGSFLIEGTWDGPSGTGSFRRFEVLPAPAPKQ